MGCYRCSRAASLLAVAATSEGGIQEQMPHQATIMHIEVYLHGRRHRHRYRHTNRQDKARQARHALELRWFILQYMPCHAMPCYYAPRSIQYRILFTPLSPTFS